MDIGDSGSLIDMITKEMLKLNWSNKSFKAYSDLKSMTIRRWVDSPTTIPKGFMPEWQLTVLKDKSCNNPKRDLQKTKPWVHKGYIKWITTTLKCKKERGPHRRNGDSQRSLTMPFTRNLSNVSENTYTCHKKHFQRHSASANMPHKEVQLTLTRASATEERCKVVFKKTRN